MFSKRLVGVLNGSDAILFAKDVGIINLLSVHLGFMFVGILTTLPHRSYPATQIRKMNIRANNSRKWPAFFLN